MFGYIYVNEQELKLKEYTSYRSFYCGLCRNLHQRYGRTAQMMLNYDLTFLAILLTGLYEPETKSGTHRCIVHPAKRHLAVENEAVDYAADMCVLLSYQKLMDDWQDERAVGKRAMAGRLKHSYEKLSAQYPRQAKAIEDNIRILHEAERADSRDIDLVAGTTGRFLAEIFVWKDDIWQEDLRRMGFYLGKFVYLMDALEDVEKDRRHGSYNVFAGGGELWENAGGEEIRAILMSMMAESARAFERLPVLEYAGIIRNILYSGVWSKYMLLKELDAEKKEKKNKREKSGQQ